MAQAAWGQMEGAAGPQGHPGTIPEQPSISLSAQAELELELSLRGSLLVQQQRRIVQLEDELQRAWAEIDRLRTKIAAVERERQRSDDDAAKQARATRREPPDARALRSGILDAGRQLRASPSTPGLAEHHGRRLPPLLPPPDAPSPRAPPPQPRYWTPEEHRLFMDAVQRYGWKDVKSIAQHVGTRTPTQVRTHAQKLFLRQQKETSGAQRPQRPPRGRRGGWRGAGNG